MPSTVLDRLRAGEVIIGDGSYVFTLERRGYVQAGEFSPLSNILGFCFRVSWFVIPANTPQRQPASNDNYYDHKANEIQIKTVEKKKK